jgi:RNA polymerase sigma factor (sigma-70 family)
VDELHAALRAGRQAKDDLVAMNAPLVLSVASKYTKYVLATGGVLQPADLMQEATIGLIRAAEKFNPQLGHRFSTYATTWIRALALASLKRNRVIALPDGVQLLYRKMVKLQHDADAGNGGLREAPLSLARRLTAATVAAVGDVEVVEEEEDRSAEVAAAVAAATAGMAATKAASTFPLGTVGMARSQGGPTAGGFARGASGPLSDPELASLLGVTVARVVAVKRAVATSVSSYDRGVGDGRLTVLDLLQSNDLPAASAESSSGGFGGSGEALVAGGGGEAGTFDGLAGAACNLLDQGVTNAPAVDLVRKTLHPPPTAVLTGEYSLSLELF